MSAHGVFVRLAIVGSLLAMSAQADAYGSLRCKGKFIRTGISVAQVISLCGEPQSRTVERIPVRTRTVTGFSRLSGVVVSERLLYGRGWGKFPVVLTFREGVLTRVDYLDYRAGKTIVQSQCRSRGASGENGSVISATMLARPSHNSDRCLNGSPSTIRFCPLSLAF